MAFRLERSSSRNFARPRRRALFSNQAAAAAVTLEVTMDLYIHEQNLAHYRRLLAQSERDPARNEVQHNWLLKLLADEEAEDTKPLDGRH
jgi:hypothetical protein